MSFRTEQSGSHWLDFPEISYYEFLTKSDKITDLSHELLTLIAFCYSCLSSIISTVLSYGFGDKAEENINGLVIVYSKRFLAVFEL